MQSRFFLATVLAGFLSFAVAACGSNESAATADNNSEHDVATQDVAAAPDATRTPADTAEEAPSMQSPVAAAPKDIIRGKGGLEEKCLKAVAAQGTKVIGTNRIEESEAAIGIYVNVEGGAAPWRCLGYRDGTIGEVMFTGDEGAL